MPARYGCFPPPGASRGVPRHLPVDTAFSPDGRHLAVTSAGSSVHVIDVATHHQVRFHPCGIARDLAWSPDGRWIAVNGSPGAHVYNARTGHLQFVTPGDTGIVNSGRLEPGLKHARHGQRGRLRTVSSPSRRARHRKSSGSPPRTCATVCARSPSPPTAARPTFAPCAAEDEHQRLPRTPIGASVPTTCPRSGTAVPSRLGPACPRAEAVGRACLWVEVRVALSPTADRRHRTGDGHASPPRLRRLRRTGRCSRSRRSGGLRRTGPSCRSASVRAARLSGAWRVGECCQVGAVRAQREQPG